MSELSKEKQDELAQKKAAHDYLATAIQILTTRVQFYHEEFEGVFTTVSFLRNMLAQVKKDIEEIEPAKPQEPQKPYVMDIPAQVGVDHVEGH